MFSHIIQAPENVVFFTSLKHFIKPTTKTGKSQEAKNYYMFSFMVFCLLRRYGEMPSHVMDLKDFRLFWERKKKCFTIVMEIINVMFSGGKCVIAGPNGHIY